MHNKANFYNLITEYDKKYENKYDFSSVDFFPKSYALNYTSDE